MTNWAKLLQKPILANERNLHAIEVSVKLFSTRFAISLRCSSSESDMANKFVTLTTTPDSSARRPQIDLTQRFLN